VRPYGNLGSAAQIQGVQSSGNSDVDALAVQYQAVATVIAANNPPADMSAAWARDNGQWQAWLSDYDQANAVSQLARRASLSAWQSIANDWGQAVRAQWPGVQTPAGFPSGQASPIGMYPSQPVAPSGGLNIPGLSSVFAAVGWIVVAVAVAAGIWILWPVLAHVV
jgi:hypothetical protein